MAQVGLNGKAEEGVKQIDEKLKTPRRAETTDEIKKKQGKLTDSQQNN
ncbi:hypothetical protein P7H12_00005 [Paenibacillus larvae]|nr:hypothetical protein [Paenibacillus larvae]MDT2262355.1 hypothetical protein [Paenibacillus larvae]